MEDKHVPLGNNAQAEDTDRSLEEEIEYVSLEGYEVVKRDSLCTKEEET